MRPGVAFRALLGHWRRHGVELATLIIGLAVATALWSGVQALNAEARASYDRAAALLGGPGLTNIVARDGGAFDASSYIALRRAGWAVSPVLDGRMPSPEGAVRVLGIDPVTLPPAAAALQIGEDGDGELLTEFLRPPHLGFAEAATVARLEAEPGLPPLEVSTTLPPDTLLVDIGVAERLLRMEGRVSRLLVAETDASEALPPGIDPRLEIVPPERDGDLDRLTASFHLNLTAFGFLSFVVGLFIVYSAIGLAFEQRKPLMRTLRACGVSARALTGLMLAETLLLALAGGLIGVIAGYAIAAALLPDVAASLGGLYGAQVPGVLSLSPLWWIAGLAMSLAGAFAASAAALWRTWRLPVLAPAQPQAWRAAQLRSMGAQRVIALAAALLALGAGLFGEGLVSGFLTMGGTLIAAALLLPSLLERILELGGRRAEAPVAQWAWADGRQQLSGLSLALMALLLALAVNVGVGTMVQSFRSTFLGYLDQRLAAEIYLSAETDAAAAEIAAWLSQRPDVDAVLPIWDARSRVADWPTEVYGLRDHATYRETWPVISAEPGAWDAIAAGGAAMISEQMARRTGLGPGDALDLPAPGGRWQGDVAGIYRDYGNPENQVLVSLAALGRHWPDADRRSLAVRAAPEASGALIAALRERFGLAERQIIDQAGLKALSQRIFEATFAVTVALNALTLVVAGIALLTSLLTLSNLRLFHLAPLWALGLTRRQLAGLEMLKTLGLALMTALAALPLGLAVAWILTAVINVQAFGWRLPVFLYPGQWATLLFLALATAGLAALWPVWRLSRAAPLTLLQSFSNER